MSSTTTGYWTVGDTNPATQVFYAGSGMVALADAGYVAWLAAGNTTLSIDTLAHLYALFADYARANQNTFLGQTTIDMATGDVSLVGNQLLSQTIITNSGATSALTLPQANLPSSPPLGFVFCLYPNNGNAVTIKKFGGATVGTLAPISFSAGCAATPLLIQMTSNDSSAGGWTVIGRLVGENYPAMCNTYGGVANGNFKFSISGITAGQTRTITPPDFDGTLATLAGTENLTNKTLTSATLATKLTKGIYVLGASAVDSSHTGDLVETTLATVTVPANTMGANGIIRVTAQWRMTGAGGSRALKIKFNGTSYNTLSPASNALSARTQCQFANRNATNSQVGNYDGQVNWSTNVVDVVTSAHDTTGALDVTLTGQLTSAGDSVAVSSYLVELILP